MKKQLLTKTLLLLFALIAGSSSSWAVEQVYSTCLFGGEHGTSNGYESTWTATNSTFSWSVTNGNTNGSNWAYVKFGRKNTASVGTVITSDAYSEAITKVGITIDALTTSKINSIKLYTSSDKTNWDEEGEFAKATGTKYISLTSPAKNLYYKVEFDCASGSSNGLIQVSQINYYHDAASSATLDHIVLGGTYQTEFYVGDTFTHDGLTVTAHYDDASSLDVTSSATFSDPDMSVAGTKTITVSFEENSVTKTATYDITVSPVPPVVLTLDFGTNIFGLPVGSANKKTESTGYTYGGYTYTLAATNGFYYGEFSGYNCLFMGKSGATLTFPAYPFKVKMIKVYGTSGASASVKQNIFVGENAICTETTGAKDVTNVYRIPSAYQISGTTFILKVTSDANTQISKIEILGDDAAPAFVGASGWSTLYCTAGLDFAKVDGLEAYVVSAVSASSVTLSAAIPHAPAGTAVILKGTPNTAYRVPVLENNYDFGTNKLLVSDGTITGGDGIYALAEKESVVGFYKVKNTVTIPAGKCYLNTAAGAPDFLGFGGDATGIDEVRGKTEEVRGEFYNLAGQRVAQPTKGLYIVNGKKVVMK